jgi:hypothetical protein
MEREDTEEKGVYITICDDYEYHLEPRISKRRKWIYYASFLSMILFLGGMFIWCYIIILEIESKKIGRV